MSFWTYMLHCNGGYFYVGQTDDLERRIGEHKSGLIPGFTADHQPVELVWSDHFENRDDAKAAEQKIKGWSRAKKLALIRGDWERIAALAKKKSNPSTSSGKTEKGEIYPPKPVHAELVEPKAVEDQPLSFTLVPHPNTPPLLVKGVHAKIWITDLNEALIEFSVEGASRMMVPDCKPPVRRDGLWNTTCFEVFLMCEDGRYFEFNLSPSTEWAIYAFDSYRKGMRALEVDIPPHVEFSRTIDTFAIEADIDFGQIPSGRLRLGFTAVVEEEGGVKSYWAIAHGPHEHNCGQPDFHHPACFAAMLASPEHP